VRSGRVVVPDVLGQDLFQMAAAEDQSPVQTLRSNRANPVPCQNSWHRV
jgi:hypothetical protein